VKTDDLSEKEVPRQMWIYCVKTKRAWSFSFQCLCVEYTSCHAMRQG